MVELQIGTAVARKRGKGPETEGPKRPQGEARHSSHPLEVSEDFDPAVLQASIASLQTTTLGEILITPDAAVAGNITALEAFMGPVLVLTGENDYSLCGFSCNGKDNPVETTLRNVFISVNPEKSKARVVPGTGHNLNTHLNAAETYSYMIDWVRKL